MKKFLKENFQKIWDYIKYLCTHPRDVLLPTLVAEIVFWIPLWVPAILALTISPWWWTVVGSVFVFWAAPFTPATLLQVGLIAAFVGIWNKIKNRRTKDDKKDDN